MNETQAARLIKLVELCVLIMYFHYANGSRTTAERIKRVAREAWPDA